MQAYLAQENIPYEGLSINEMIFVNEWGQPGSTVANYMNVESVGETGQCMACPNVFAGPNSGAIDTNWYNDASGSTGFVVRDTHTHTHTHTLYTYMSTSQHTKLCDSQYYIILYYCFTL